MLFHQRLAMLRSEKGVTQHDVARFLRISRTTYAHYEIGRRAPDFETLVSLAKYYGVTTDYLLGISEERPVPKVTEADRKRAEIKNALQSLVSHDDGEFPIEDDLVDTIYDAMMKGREFHTKRKQKEESKKKGDDK
jgi:transcriptional regulator with XRE-family HTH domain